MTAYAPQPRVLNPGPPLETGDDVAVYQEVLKTLGFVKNQIRKGEYAQNTWEAVELCGKAHGIEPQNVLGPRVHAILSKHMTPGQGLRLALALGDQQGGKGHRIAQVARWFLPYWLNYQATRPLPDVIPPLIPQESDCSFFYTRCLLGAGFKDAIPLSEHQGSTHTLVNYGTHVATIPSAIRPGDAVFVDGPDGQNSHMFVAWNTTEGISHGKPGVNFEPYSFYPIFAVRRYV